ncbi:MAG TPA: glycogen/starch synthase, partial [Planctomycetia bacterium]|nr:glycogen/starch synthase [Planctomycetia bacterium]
MQILMCASEVAPYAKTGGLADVVGALPPYLAALGHDVRIVTPLHGSIARETLDLKARPVRSLGVPMGGGEEWCAVWESRLSGSDVPIYFLEHNRFFDRPGIYTHQGRDYEDNAERFAFLPRAACQLCKQIDWRPDVIHAHDWPSALAPMFLKTFYQGDPLLGNAASVLTIHNIGYQGSFPKEQIAHSGLGWEWYTPGGLEFYDKANYLKAGILFADKIVTVSPTYAAEIQTREGGWALDGAVRSRSADVLGILNGLDYNEWNPAADRHLPATFDVDIMAGKAACKAALQEEFGLPVDPKVPLFGMVSRLAYQKGIDVLAGAGAARGNVPGTDQRHAIALASTVDLDEAYRAGQKAAELAA